MGEGHTMTALAEPTGLEDALPFEVRDAEPGWHPRSERCYVIDSWLKSTVPKGKGKHAAFKHLRELYTGYLDSHHVLKLVAVDPQFPTLVVGWFIRVPPPPGYQGPILEVHHVKAWADPYEGLILEVLREVADRRRAEQCRSQAGRCWCGSHTAEYMAEIKEER